MVQHSNHGVKSHVLGKLRYFLVNNNIQPIIPQNMLKIATENEGKAPCMILKEALKWVIASAQQILAGR